jgi:hypothetical protein
MRARNWLLGLGESSPGKARGGVKRTMEEKEGGLTGPSG